MNSGIEAKEQELDGDNASGRGRERIGATLDGKEISWVRRTKVMEAFKRTVSPAWIWLLELLTRSACLRFPKYCGLARFLTFRLVNPNSPHASYCNRCWLQTPELLLHQYSLLATGIVQPSDSLIIVFPQLRSIICSRLCIVSCTSIILFARPLISDFPDYFHPQLRRLGQHKCCWVGGASENAVLVLGRSAWDDGICGLGARVRRNALPVASSAR
jgi:hypothetical protein